jgi:3D (Asp-Asp-Asp) domain-containing protein
MIQRRAALAAAFFLTATWTGLASTPKNLSTDGPRIEGVKTTAYSASVEDNGDNDGKNALGRPLKTGRVTSAAADWSRWPVGTRFRIVETGQEYIVDDYGSALVGTGTIDLYKTSDSQVDRWGVRHVTIEILEWGSPQKSLQILRERRGARHIREMVKALQSQEVA